MAVVRRLTAAERALVAEVFGGSLDATRVWLAAIPLWRRAFVAGSRLMVWPARTIRPDYAAPDVPLTEVSVFVHELVHVWQAQAGVSLIAGKLRAGDGPAAYAYDLDRPFEALNIEQQAMAVQHAFLARRGGRAPHTAAELAAFLPTQFLA